MIITLKTFTQKTIQKLLKLSQIRCISNDIQNPKPSQAVTKLRIFSGIQPTGALHLGNYLGAIRHWVAYQNDRERVDSCLYSIVDLHSLTTIQNRDRTRDNIKLMTATLLACGIDPNQSVLFLQSDVPFHGQLAWILATLVPMAQLYRFPQFKDKTMGMKEIPLGLYLYPILQIADILLYKTNGVPVGDDQSAHLNFCRHLAHKFNTTFGERVFIEPKTICPQMSGRIRSLRKPENKMSKSEPNLKSRIDITDTSDDIRDKIRKAVTDMRSEVTYEPESRPGVSNLVLIYSLLSDLTPEQVCADNKGRNTGEFKLVLCDLVVEHLRPIRDNFVHFMADSSYLDQVLSVGRLKAYSIAEQTMSEVYEAIGSQAICKSVDQFSGQHLS